MSSRLLTAGFVCAALCLFLPILWPAVLVIGIIAIVRKAVTAGVVLLVLAFVMPLIGAALVVRNFVKPYRVPSENMNPTLRVGDRFLVWRLGAGAATSPRRSRFRPIITS